MLTFISAVCVVAADLSSILLQDNCPQLSLSPATFTTAAKAALSAAGITLASGTTDTAFNPYIGQLPFYLGAFIFEVSIFSVFPTSPELQISPQLV